MSKKIQIPLCIIIIAVLVCTAVFAGSGGAADFVTPDTTSLDLNSCRHTHEDSERGKAQPNLLSDLSGYGVISENKNYALYYREDNCNLRVLNKKTGYVWGGVNEDGKEHLNDTWLALADSLVTFTYLNEECTSAQISINDPRIERTFEKKDGGAVISVSDTVTQISFDISIKLFEDSVSVSMVDGSLSEEGSFLLESVYIMPFFGCTYNDTVSGYIFVPDGAGALIRYAESTKYISAFDKRVYGIDPAIDSTSNSNDLLAKRTNDYLTDTPEITAPVFGAVHGVGCNAFFAVIENGATYSSICASPAGYVIDYNRVTARFDFRTVYSQTLKKDGSGIPVNQGTPNDMSPSVRYYFLDGENADYSGMAVKYRNILKAKSLKNKTEREDEDIPLRLDIVAADVKSGKFFNKYIKMTSVNEAAEICGALGEENVNNITLSYKGWTKGGLNGGKYGNIAFDKRLGSDGDLQKLKKQLENSGGRLYLGFNALTANKDQCNPDMDSAKTISNKNMGFVRDNKNIKYNVSYVMRPKSIISSVVKLKNKYGSYSLLLSGLGDNSFADFTKGETVTRAANDGAVAKLIGKTENSIALSAPNSYLWGDTDDYFDMPLENSQYMYETDSVPFLPIVLKGSVDYYSPYINQGYYTEDSILKIIEYGAYPSFLTMKAENEKLIGTPSADYFSINIDNWKDAAVSSYKQINEVLKQTEGADITEHRVIKDGVVRVKYSNGAAVYVNYLNEDYKDGNITVKAKSSICTKGVA